MNDILRIIHVTHSDLDGIGCEVLSRAAYSSSVIEVYNEEYATVNERIAHIIENCYFDILFITDISPRDKKIITALNELSKTKIIRLVDHHDTSESRFDGMNWARFTTGSQCGALAFYYTLTNEFQKDISYLYDFAKAVNDYDLWLKARPDSEILNSLLSFYGHKKFVRTRLSHDYYSQPYIMTTEEIRDANLYQQYVNRMVADNVTKARLVTTTDNKRIVVVYANDHASQIGERVRYDSRFKDCHCTAIVNMDNNAVSLRSIDPDFNVGLFAQSRGGGGNPKTAGFALDATRPLSFALGLLED